MIKVNEIQVVILAGGCDFTDSSTQSQVPPGLWPVPIRPAIIKVLDHLKKSGVERITICSNSETSCFQYVLAGSEFKDARFLPEDLPVGTAGCVRDAVAGDKGLPIMIMPANIVNPPKVTTLLKEHEDAKSDLTVFFNPSGDKTFGPCAGIYIFEPSVLEYIPAVGYFDIKESLIPALQRAGKRISALKLNKAAGNFKNRQEYLNAVGDCLEAADSKFPELAIFSHSRTNSLWMASSASIDKSARIYGRVVVKDGARISENAIIFGPTVIGRDVTVGGNSVVAGSILWDNARIGRDCQIQRCLVGSKAVVRDNKIIEETSASFKREGILQKLFYETCESGKSVTRKLNNILKETLDNNSDKLPPWLNYEKVLRWGAVGLLLTVFLWSYWPGLKDLWRIWERSDEYSSGLLVPFLAVYILWSRRADISRYPVKPSIFWGVLAFLGAQFIRFFGLFFMYGSAERLSIAVSIAAMVLLLFGWQFFKKVFTILLFMCLMLPWPNRVQAAMAVPLQSWATSSAVFCLELMGYPIIRDGNVINIGQTSVAVAEACNGLRMITAFFVISGLVVLVIKRPWWEKLVILLSSLPIALLCNTIRLTVTAIAFTMLEGEYWEKIFHDFGGYAMMPLALGIIVFELWLMKKLTTPPGQTPVEIIVRGTN